LPDLPVQADEPDACYVLVLDPDADMRGYVGRSVAALLQHQPAHVLEAADAEHAFRIAAQAGICLFVADADAPGLDAAHLVATLSADARLRRVPLLLLTATSSAGLAFPHQVCAILPKPFTRRALAAALQTLAPHL
jgi:CheY-like chemotaxis protein